MKNQELRNKIALDLFVTPWTIIPGTVGLSLLVLSMILGGSIGFIGFCFCLVGLGSLSWNFVFNFDHIKKKAAQDWVDKIKKEKNQLLDALDRKLVKNKDPRDQTALRDLRVMYAEFQKDIENNKISKSITSDMFYQVDQIFETCVHELEQSHNIWRMTNNKISDALKVQLQSQREEIINAVQESVGNMAFVINEIRSVRHQSDANELRVLGQKLTSRLEAVKQIEERVSKIGSEDLERFDRYIVQE